MDISHAGLDPVTGAYFLAFVIGAGFSVLGFVLGAAKRAHGHHGRGAHGARVAPHGRHAPHPPNPGGRLRVADPLFDLGAWAALACVLGATGYLLRRAGWSGLGSLAAALPPALAAAGAVHAFGRFLASKSGWLAPDRLEGSVAVVHAPFRRGAIGEVTLVVRGAKRTLPAKTTHEHRLERGREVVIVQVDRGIAWVETY